MPEKKSDNLEQRYFFVVGNSRSGTTMMGRIIGNHPDAFFFYELHYFEQMASSQDFNKLLDENKAKTLLMRLFTVQHDGYFHQGDPLRYQSQAEAVLATLPPNQRRSIEVYKAFLRSESQFAGKKYPILHTPQNIFYLREILQLIPDARVVNMIRDPRDVLLSQKRRWRRRFMGNKHIPLQQVLRYWVNYHPITISKLWNASVRAGDAFQSDARMLQLRFEDLVATPKTNVQALCNHLGLLYLDGMENVPQIGSSSGKDHPDQKKIDPNAASRWQKGGLTEAEIYLCQNICRENMQRHGYPPEVMKTPVFGLLKAYFTFPLKIFVAFFLNLGRMKNVLETIRRRLR